MSTTPPGPKRLTRTKDDRVIAGVCAGVAKYFGIDPVIARVVAIVLVFFGGAGALLYVAALLLVPTEGEGGATIAPDRNRWLIVLGVVVLICVIGPFVAAPAFIAGGLLFPLAFLVIAALVATWLVTGRWPDREVGPIARATALGLALLTVLFLIAGGAFWGSAAGGDEVVAGLVIAAGVAILAGAFLKPVRWLIPLALAMAIPAGFVSAAGIELDGGIGEKRYRPGTVAEVRDRYELGVGQLVVDLRGLDLPTQTDQRLDLDIGIGHALLLVDEDVCVATEAQVGIGAVEVFEQNDGGIDIDVEDAPKARSGLARVVVSGDVGVGFLEVASREPNEIRVGRSPFGSRFEPFDGFNDACVSA